MDTVKPPSPMADDTRCPKCGTPLPKGALAGLCPACLLQVGAAPDTVTGGQPAFTPPPIPELVPLFPQLEILELIGRGGMGAVYKARQKELDRVVALKILPPGIGQDPAFAERFTREARALARLSHPGIVTLYEFGRADGLFFFLMEFVDGVNLRQLLQAGRVEPREALAIVPQICDALQYAHDLGIVHRDIKPENILLDRRGRVKVADFGLAKIVAAECGRLDRSDAAGSDDVAATGAAVGDDMAAPGTGALRDLTDAGKLMGTPQYMSPEQVAAPGDVDHRADIYALGVVFYQMLTGELPGKAITPPSAKVRIDVRLDEVVLRALEQNPELRYQQASVLKTQVETIASGNEPPPLAGSKPEMKPRFSRTAIAGACCAAVGLGVALSLLLFWLSTRAHHAAMPLWLSLVLWAGVVPLMLISLTGATILGWVAVSQIRRSAGKVYGLGLAVACGLLLPLLAVNAIFLGAASIVHASILLLPLVLVLDWMLIRPVWRSVNKSKPGMAAVEPTGRRLPGKTAMIIGAGLAGMFFFLLLPVAAGLLRHHPREIAPVPAQISPGSPETPRPQETNFTSPAPVAAQAFNKTPDYATLSEPPVLRFVAWQDEWRTNQPGAARHPDGSAVTNADELGWLGHVSTGGVDVDGLPPGSAPRFLHLWFSHPLFGRDTHQEVSLLDEEENMVPLDAGRCGVTEDPNAPNGNLGWYVNTLSPDRGASLKVQLRYTLGPLEKVRDVPVTTNSFTDVGLEGGSFLNGVGQNGAGKAFVAIAVNTERMNSRQFGVIAVTKDGRELTVSARSTGGISDSHGVRFESFVFDTPLEAVAKFRIGTRPIRTNEWKNIVLPGDDESGKRDGGSTASQTKAAQFSGSNQTARTETLLIQFDGSRTSLTLGGQLCEWEQLPERLKALTQGGPVAIQIRADPDIAFETIRVATDACRKAGTVRTVVLWVPSEDKRGILTDRRQPPQLRHIAWYNEWEKSSATVLSPARLAREQEEKPWLNISPAKVATTTSGDRILCLWFSHPLFTYTSFSELTFLNKAGQPIPTLRSGAARPVPSTSTNTPGWLCWTVVCQSGQSLPERVTVRLRYAVSPMDRMWEIPAVNKVEFLTEKVRVSAMGQDQEKRAFLNLTVDPTLQSQFTVAAFSIGQDWCLPSNGDSRGQTLQRFDFDLPLSEVDHFVITSRPILTQEWKGVMLPSS